MYLRSERLVGAVVEQKFDDIDVVLLSGDVQRRESILHTSVRPSCLPLSKRMLIQAAY